MAWKKVHSRGWRNEETKTVLDYGRTNDKKSWRIVVETKKDGLKTLEYVDREYKARVFVEKWMKDPVPKEKAPQKFLKRLSCWHHSRQ